MTQLRLLFLPEPAAILPVSGFSDFDILAFQNAMTGGIELLQNGGES